MHRLVLLGLNHTTAPLPVREKLAMSAEQRAAALAEFKRRFAGCEAVILCTCNRVEFYTARSTPDQLRLEDLGAFVAELRGLDRPSLSPHLYHKVDRSVVEHLFLVACSLDSMVLGETQILGQVRDAYDAARAAGAAGAMLNPLFQRAVAVGKQVLSQTALAEGRVSVASVAVDYARRIFDTFADKSVLVVGAGKMSALLLSHLADLSPKSILVCNRDLARAGELARRHGASAVEFASLGDHLAAADIVVSSTGSTEPIVSRKTFDGVMRRRRHKPVFLIDLAVPRDIEPAVGDLDNVYLYNLDDLQQVVAATRSQRQGEIERATKIVAEQLEQYSQWQQVRQVGPLIRRLYRQSHAIAAEELSRTLGRLPDLTPEDRAHLEDLTRRIVNKLLHHPVQRLRRSDGLRASTANQLNAMEALFDLGGDDDPADSAPPTDDPT